MRVKPNTCVYIEKVIKTEVRCDRLLHSLPLFTHNFSLCSFNKTQLPWATRRPYQPFPHLPFCYQPGLVHIHIHTLCPFLSNTLAFFYLGCWLSLALPHAHMKTGEWMLWGLISVLRGLAATSQSQIPVPRPQRQTYVTRELMNKASMLLESL